MACKKPIFMLIDGVSRELVEQAQCGVYVEPENPTDFKAKIERFIAYPEGKLENLGNSGYNHAKEYFGRDMLAAKYLAHIEKVVL